MVDVFMAFLICSQTSPSTDNHLFISKRVDRIHSRRLSCRIESKETADGTGKGHCEQNVCNVDDRRPAAKLRDKYAKNDPDQHPYDAAEQSQHRCFCEELQQHV